MSDVGQLDGQDLLQLSLADRVDLICDAFEDAWTRGESPRIEDYLEQCDPGSREFLLTELLLVDREVRAQRGETVSRNSYQKRFPEFSTLIEKLEFATIGESHRGRHLAIRNDMLPAAGTTIAHFELLAELGAGASGTVWKARDTRLQRLVALKIPRYELRTRAERERFLREGQACAQLGHPNIVTVYEVGTDRGRVFIVAEFIDGESLREWLTTQRPTPLTTAELTAQLAEALHHAHEQGIIHRDLKSANVLIDHDGRPYITDFGLAKWAANSSGMTVDGNILGTPAYMSPEQARGDTGEVDRRADVYGLGALLYEMLTGQPPFQGDIATIVHQVIHTEPCPPRKLSRSVPRDLETICQTAMAKAPARRYPSAQEMAVDLRRFLRGEPIFARRASLAEQSWRWISRRKALAGMVATTLAATGSLTLAGLLTRENRALLGLRSVVLSTDPPDAKVAFIPLSESTGEPRVDDAVFAASERVKSVELLPGDYLVVAVMHDGRFHEVYRHVPDRSEPMPGSHNHRRWEQTPEGAIVLPRVTIPPFDVTSGMALIQGSDTFRMGLPGSTVLPVHKRRVASFYVDQTEFTFADYKKLAGQLPRRFRQDLESEQLAMPMDYHKAVACAEELGKRLPTEVEYEYAATARGQSTYPWGNSKPPSAIEAEIGPVTQPDFDLLDTDVPVFGLCTNAAEWTSSWAVPYPPHLPTTGFENMKQSRIVRGGVPPKLATTTAPTSQPADPRQRVCVPCNHSDLGLGFRCVRSARPLIAFADFP